MSTRGTVRPYTQDLGEVSRTYATNMVNNPIWKETEN